MTDHALDAEIALERFVSELFNLIGPNISKGRVVRDVFGRLSFVCPEHLPEEDVKVLREAPLSALPFVQSAPLLEPNSPLSKSLLRERGIVWETWDKGIRATLLDRRLAGEAWLQEPSPASTEPVRVAFYGLKGGVGRSTALAVAAADLAARGHNVLVLDLDLEAPGQSDLLLGSEGLPDFGVVDWLAARTAGEPAADLLPDMIGGCPFTNGSGVVDVVPASGRSSARYPAGYLAKLSRAYTPGAMGETSGSTFSDKVSQLLTLLSKRRDYSAVLIDVRAGLHETSAASLLTLGCYCYLFGTSSPQTFSGYNVLLSSIRQAMSSWPSSTDIRDRFRMVHGRAGAGGNERAEYQAQCWALWLQTLYDEVGNEPDATAFTFDLDDNQGPHFPCVIGSSEVFLNFDPKMSPFGFDRATYEASFGGLTAHLLALIEAGTE